MLKEGRKKQARSNKQQGKAIQHAHVQCTLTTYLSIVHYTFTAIHCHALRVHTCMSGVTVLMHIVFSGGSLYTQVEATPTSCWPSVLCGRTLTPELWTTLPPHWLTSPGAGPVTFLVPSSSCHPPRAILIIPSSSYHLPRTVLLIPFSSYHPPHAIPLIPSPSHHPPHTIPLIPSFSFFFSICTLSYNIEYTCIPFTLAKSQITAV